MKKYFVVADVHSFYDEFMDALNKAGFDKANPDHILISCGDLMDRGPSPLNCLIFVNSLPKERKILVRGNHEDLLEECIARKECLYHDYHNGTVATIADLSYMYYKAVDDIYKAAFNNSEYKKYRASLVDYAEVSDYIFVHGWIPCNRVGDESRNSTYSFEENWKDGDWYTARWYNGMEAWHQGVKIDGKTIVCGHWHCSYGNSKFHNDGVEWPKDGQYANFDPFIDDGIIALDQCAAISKKVNCYTFEVE